MNLITATLRAYLLFTLLAFLAGGAVTIFLLRTVMYEEIDEGLLREVQKIRIEIQKKGLDKVEIALWEREVHKAPEEMVPTINWRDTSLIEAEIEDHESELEEVPYRQVTITELIDNQPVTITLRASRIETEDLVEVVFLSLILLFGLMLIGLMVINRQVLKRIWKPFFQTLEALKTHRITDNDVVDLPPTDISEFRQLQDAFLALISQATLDYEALKNFTENASHEIQTPLATAKTDLDMLLQTGEFSVEQKAHLHTLYLSLNRLQRLNKGLLLLSKIENRQYDLVEALFLDKILQQSVANYQDMATQKDITVLSPNKFPLQVKGSKALLEILCDNLLKNALQHSIRESTITLSITNGAISISNPGNPLPVASHRLFERFTKANPTSASLGLGLAICQKICIIHGFTLSHTYQAGFHHFRVSITE